MTTPDLPENLSSLLALSLVSSVQELFALVRRELSRADVRAAVLLQAEAEALALTFLIFDPIQWQRLGVGGRNRSARFFSPQMFRIGLHFDYCQAALNSRAKLLLGPPVFHIWGKGSFSGGWY